MRSKRKQQTLGDQRKGVLKNGKMGSELGQLAARTMRVEQREVK